MKRVVVFVVVLVSCAVAHGGDRLDLYGPRDARLEVAAAAQGPLYLAQSRGSRPMRVSGAGQTVMVGADYSFGSDITALFRPSRWRRPLSPGGVISWVNPWSWGSDPYRTTTVLVGELLFVGASYGIYKLFDEDSDDSYQPPPVEPVPSPVASGSGGGGDDDDAPPPPTSGGSSGGGGSIPEESGGGGVEEF
jgi:hypothetical protein